MKSIGWSSFVLQGGALRPGAEQWVGAEQRKVVEAVDLPLAGKASPARASQARRSERLGLDLS
jgi:hypothetical protein